MIAHYQSLWRRAHPWLVLLLFLSAAAAGCAPKPLPKNPTLLVERITSTCVNGNEMKVEVWLRGGSTAPDQYELIYEPGGGGGRVVQSGTIPKPDERVRREASFNGLPPGVVVSVFRIDPRASLAPLPTPAAATSGRRSVGFDADEARPRQPNPCLPKSGFGPASARSSR